VETEDKEQRQSKKWKNRERKKGKNYGVQVPPSSWIKMNDDQTENGGGDTDSTTMSKRVTLFVNGDKGNGKAFLIKSDDWTDFLKQGGNKMRMRGVTRAFNDDGKELNSIDDIKQDDNIFLSKKGQDFIRITNPDDQITVRGAIADLHFDFVEVKLPCLEDTAIATGRIALYHRPKRQHLNVLSENGCTHLCTLLSAREKGEELGNRVLDRQKEGDNINWIWIPLAGADPPDEELYLHILKGIREVIEALKGGGSVVIHCSAGLHRTGMIANALLRYGGYDKEQAIQIIAKARLMTAEQCGAHRLAWSDTFIDKVGTYSKPLLLPT